MGRSLRLHRLVFVGLSLGALSLASGGSLAGCGDSEASPPPSSTTNPGEDGGGPVGPDGTAPGADGSTPEPNITIDIVVPDAKVYVGQQADLVASQSKASDNSTLSFGWKFKTVPAGSTITDLSFQGLNELVSFIPDIAGDYVITVTAKSGKTESTKDITVHAYNAPVFYVKSIGGSTVQDVGYEMHTVQMDGTGDHAVACRQKSLAQFPGVGDSGAPNLDFDAGDSSQGMTLNAAAMFMTIFFADQAIDWWEAPAGDPSQAAFQNLIAGGDAGPDVATNKISLVVATQDNTCQNPPFTAVEFLGKGDDSVLQPKFSPDGHRLAYVERKGGKSMVVTVGRDGSDYRPIGTYCENGGSECYSQNLWPRRPQWIDETHVGWMRATTQQNDDGIGWEIIVAPDIPSATTSRYMTCTSGALPTLFNFLRDGTVLANVRATRYGAEDLLVLKQSPTGQCQPERNLTNFTIPGSYARDFSISPDGNLVAYIHHVAETSQNGGKPDAGALDFRQGGYLFTVPINGTAPPTPLGDSHTANFGPRWIAGGTRLSWNGNAPPPAGYDAGLLGAVGEGGTDDGGVDAAATLGKLFAAGIPAMNVIQADGGGFLPVALGDPANGEYVVGGGNGGACSLECGGCKPQCDQQTCGPGSNCAAAEKRGGPTATFCSALLGLVLVFRRRARRG